MSKFQLNDGVWPTMITPFTDDGAIDYAALEKNVEWYIERGVAGLFAVCQSSEMFQLSKRERVELSAAVEKMSGGRVQVVASGHISDAVGDQIDELKAVADTGVSAVVIITNRFARPEQGDEAWKSNAEKILAALPDTLFGLYECPYPYKRLMSPELLKWCAGTGRFAFLKDTCCNLSQIRAKLAALEGTSLKLFNANSATLLDSLKMGAAGFSGVMANMHPQLYAWLCCNWQKQPELAQSLQDFLGVSSVGLNAYPIDGKYYLQLEELPLTLNTRVKALKDFGELGRINMQQVRRQTQFWEAILKN